MTTESEFTAGIRHAIEEEIKTDEHNAGYLDIDRETGHIEFIDSPVDTQRWAAAVHQYIVETLAPPFGQEVR